MPCPEIGLEGNGRETERQSRHTQRLKAEQGNQIIKYFTPRVPKDRITSPPFSRLVPSTLDDSANPLVS